MSEILAFIKAHRRDIIITASALAASLVVMLLIPALIVGNAPSTAGMLACIALFFAVDPAFCLAAAIFAGWDLRRRWFTALFPPLAFLISTGAVFGRRLHVLFRDIPRNMPDSHPGNSPCKEIRTLRKLTNIYPQKYQQENKMPENNEKEPQYKSILSDDDGTAPRPIRKKQRDPMAEVRREIEEQQRQQREKAELLKLRQGLIDESDEIPEDEPPKFEKPTGAKAVENFFYHYKWRLIGIIFTVALLTFMIIQTVTREKKDLYVLAISTTGSSGIYAKTHDIEVALERYCPDFDGNGKVHVGVNFIDLSTEGGYSEYTDAQNEKFSAELFSGDSQLYLTDEGIITLINRIAASGETEEAAAEEADGQIIQFFTDFSGEYPDAVLYDGCGLQLNTTGFVDEARWKSCPDTVGLYLRDTFENMMGNNEKTAEQRERARIVYENIINGNVVNPDWQGS
mgnify:CR=1 FL=1